MSADFLKVDERDGSCSHFDSLKKDGQARYLIKDPGSGSRNGKHPGYNFYQEELREVQMMNVMVHRSAAENVLKKNQPKAESVAATQ
ncbi:MAG: hypothetical protein OEZ41_08930 [Nitrospirota bacterium]|nr:hypothetical protein [Nitrospirota bacterium]